MRTVELRTDVPGYVLFLENPTKVYRRNIEGSIEQRIRRQVEQFITGATPESALQPRSKFPNPLRQLKDRGGKIRALGTWCKAESFDLFVVQVLYDKGDENDYLPYKYEFAERGEDLQERFDNMERDVFRRKIREWQNQSDLLVFTPEDFHR